MMWEVTFEKNKVDFQNGSSISIDTEQSEKIRGGKYKCVDAHENVEIPVEDFLTCFASKFVEDILNKLQITSLRYLGKRKGRKWYVPFLKMSLKRRRALVSKVLEKINNE